MNLNDRSRPVRDSGHPEARPEKTLWTDQLCEQPLDRVRGLVKEHQKAHEAMTWNCAALPESLWNHHDSVAFFAPRSDWREPQAFPPLPDHVRRAYPRMNSDRSLSFHALPSEKSLTWNAQWKVWEAPASFPTVEPSCLFIPCALADRQGARIGRGGGFYDRYLAEHPSSFRVGVLHSDYVLDRIPHHWLKPHDQKLQALLTESEFMNCHLQGETQP